VVTNGGRVLAVTSYGNSFEEAIKKSYQNIEELHFDKMYFRKDIGKDLFLKKNVPLYLGFLRFFK
jgi:phosphoribosylamine--glycine ligase